MRQVFGSGKIFEEIRIGAMTVANRIVAAPFCSRLADPEGFVTPDLIDYWEQRAIGGAGLIILEAAAIDHECCRLERNQLAVNSDDCHVGLAILAESIQAHGSRVILQLAHAGRQTMPPAIWGRTPLAPSAIPCPYMSRLRGETNPTREITLEEMEAVKGSFATAARRAQLVGFDGVELHFAHGYLVGSFLSSHTNKRTDRYGGSLGNRARFAIEIIEACRDEVGPSFPLGVRMTADEYIDGGITLEESLQVAQWFERAKIDYLHVSASNYETVEMQCPTNYQPRALLVPLATHIKTVVSIPVIAVGSITAELAVRIIEEGRADLVAIGRGFNADPHLPVKLAENRLNEIIPCIRCNRCVESEGQEHPTRCETNFLTGRRLRYPMTRSYDQREVVVVGGGPSGLEAARVAALRGHRVKLYEEQDRLGGSLLAASVPDFMDDFRRLISYYEAQLEKLGVDIVLKKAYLPEDVKLDRPDTLVLAMGGKPVEISLPGDANGCVVQSIEALTGNPEVGQKLIVLGGNYISCQISAHFAQQGHHVTLVTQRTDASQLAGELEAISQNVLVKMINELGVEIAFGHKIIELREGKASLSGTNGSAQREFDHLVLSLGFLPRKRQISAFGGLCQRIYAIGDCVRPRRVGPAIHEGFIAGYQA